MKTQSLFILLLCGASTVLFSQYYQVKKYENIPGEGAIVHAMGTSRSGHILAVGEQPKDGAGTSTMEGFVSFYNEQISSDFVSKSIRHEYGSALFDVCSDDFDGAWVVGYRENGIGNRKGYLQRMRWSAKRGGFEVDEDDTHEREENAANVVFNAVCRLPDNRLLVGGYMKNLARGQKGPEFTPVLMQFKNGELSPLNPKPVALSSLDESAAIIDLLPSTSGEQVAIMVEYLIDEEASTDRYQEFLFLTKLDSDWREVTKQWDIGGDKRFSAGDFSLNIRNEVIATGAQITRKKPGPWLAVTPMTETKAIRIPIESSQSGHDALGGHVMLKDHLMTVSGKTIDELTHLEEFDPVPEDDKSWPNGRTEQLSVGEITQGILAPKFFEDKNYNLWLYGQVMEDNASAGSIAVLLTADEATVGLSRSPLEQAIDDNLSIKLSLHFGSESSNNLPAGERGYLRVEVQNKGVTKHRLEAVVSVEGEAQGIQFLSEKPIEREPIKGIAKGETVRFTFPIETTEKVSARTGARFTLKIIENNKIIKERSIPIYTTGNKYTGYKIEVDKNFGGNTSPEAPTRTGTKLFQITTQVSTTGKIGASNVILRNNGVIINKGRGENEGVKVKKHSDFDKIVYNVELELELDTNLNSITYEIQIPGQPPIISDVRYVSYSNLPTLHYFGIAPDYSGLSEYSKLKYNEDDVRDLAAELIRTQNNGLMYNQVLPKFLTAKEQTTTQEIRDFFGRLGQQLTDTLAADYIDKEDLVIVHFAAHGILRKNNKKYGIIPSDYDEGNTSRFIDYENDIIESLEGLKRRVVILIDACRNPTSENSRGGGEPDRKLMEQLFAEHQQAKGIVTFAAADVGERAYEADQWKNGLFTEALLEALRGATGEDKNGSPINADDLFAEKPDGYLTVRELAKYLRQRVPGLIMQTDELKGKQQHPSLINNKDSDQLPQDFRLFSLRRDQ